MNIRHDAHYLQEEKKIMSIMLIMSMFSGFVAKFDMRLAELEFGDVGWGAGHQAKTRLRLGEGYDISDGIALHEEHHDAVKTEGDASMRRCAICERL